MRRHRRPGWASPRADVATIVTMVRLHLLLPDTATRRDLDDPATAAAGGRRGRRPDDPRLLAAMVEADSLATGPSAWGTWKAGLVADLVERTRRLLAGEPVAPPTPLITEDLEMVMDTVRTHGVPALSIDAPRSPWWPPTGPDSWPRSPACSPSTA